MVDLVLVQAHSLDEVDLDLVAGGHTVDEVLAVDALVLGDGEDRRDIVTGVGVLGGEEGVVEVEFAHGHTVGPCRPLRGEPVAQRQAEDAGAGAEGMGLRLLASVHRSRTAHRGGRDGGVVDDAVDDHVDDFGFDLDRVHGDLGDAPGELAFAGEVLVAAVLPCIRGWAKPTLVGAVDGLEDDPAVAEAVGEVILRSRQRLDGLG